MFVSRIRHISGIPDTTTGLYNIEIECDGLDEPFGATVTGALLFGTG